MGRAVRTSAKIIQSRNIISDMMDLLDMAGVDNIDRARLDDLAHAGQDMQSLIDFASEMHRRNGYRVDFFDMLTEYFGGKK